MTELFITLLQFILKDRTAKQWFFDEVKRIIPFHREDYLEEDWDWDVKAMFEKLPWFIVQWHILTNEDIHPVVYQMVYFKNHTLGKQLEKMLTDHMGVKWEESVWVRQPNTYDRLSDLMRDFRSEFNILSLPPQVEGKINARKLREAAKL